MNSTRGRGRAKEDESANADSDDESAAVAALQETFQPIFELVFPDSDVEDEDEEEALDVTTLLEFFRSRGVRDIEDLKTFDSHHLIWDEFLSKSFDERETVQRLGTICEYVAMFGAESLLKFVVELYKKPMWECEHCCRFAAFEDDNETKNLHIQSCESNSDNRMFFSTEKKRSDCILIELRRAHLCAINNNTTQQQRPCMQGVRMALRNLFRDQSFWQLMRDPEARNREMNGRALALLDLYPSLAWERFEHGLGTGIHSPPFFYFLWAGCEMDVLRRVLIFNPKVLSTGKQGFEDLLMAASLVSENIPIEIFDRMFQLLPNLTRERRHRTRFLERLFYLGFNATVLDFVRTRVQENQREFTLCRRSPRMVAGGRRWEMDISRASVVVKMLPHLRRVECDISEWTLDGWAHLLSCVPDVPRPNLEAFRISLPVHIVPSEMRRKQALERFFTRMDFSFSLKEIALLGGREHQRPFETFAFCLKEVASGIIANKSNTHLRTLMLQQFALSAEGARHLFAHDMFACLDVQFDSLRYSCPWDDINSEGVRVLNLRIHGVRATIEGWQTLWDCISKTRVQKIMYSPGHVDHNSGWFDCPLKSMARLRTLSTLCITAHTHDTTLDVTQPLVDLLEHNTLEFLQIEGSHEDHEGNIDCLAYRIRVDEFCGKLKHNRSLQFLFLRGVELRGDRVSKAFLDVLQVHNNTTIEFMDICDDAYFYTIIPKDSWRRDVHHGFTYESFPWASEIYFLTCFNRFGRGKVQDKSTGAADFVKLLADVHSIDIDPEEEKCHKRIVDLSSRHQKNTEVEHLSDLFHYLLEKPSLWCDAVKRNTEAMSIRYGLLRESPGLWCSCVLQDAPGFAVKRRRLE